MHEPLRIRQATLADAGAISEVHVGSWQWAYRGLIPVEHLDHLDETLGHRIEQWTGRLTDGAPEERIWVAERGERVVGFVMTGPSRDADAPEGTAEVRAIYLTLEAAGRGIGRELFKRAVEDLRARGYDQVTLWVLAGNERARRFYEAAGWSIDGATKTEDRGGLLLNEVRYRIRLG